MARNQTIWKTVFAYSPMSSGRAERMLGTLKVSIGKVLLGSVPASGGWDEASRRFPYGYRRRKKTVRLSLFDLFVGVFPRMAPGEMEPFFGVSEVCQCEMELLHARAMRALTITGRGPGTPSMDGRHASLNVSDEILVAKWGALGTVQKWPTALLNLYGPCRSVRTPNPRYKLVAPY